MHRTQIMLEDWQYEDLKASAEREGRSLSSLVRDAVTAFLRRNQRPNRTRLAEIAGIGEDAGGRGRDHDEVLYGPRRTRR
jgi:hypothetical protein